MWRYKTHRNRAYYRTVCDEPDCGGKALYLVGSRVFCRKHRMKAIQARQWADQKYHSAERNEFFRRLQAEKDTRDLAKENAKHTAKFRWMFAGRGR